jgi:hypothetical protein
MDLALKAQRLESIVVLLLAEFPIDSSLYRRIENMITRMEPNVMGALAMGNNPGGNNFFEPTCVTWSAHYDSDRFRHLLYFTLLINFF